ncbi:unnamed protein product [Adineta steineri]|uniref:Uncharacterized protein n=1 Tax=Adineta steineri TaxID=433720 RepID=A0A815FX54_9BILA|nr:unnamed protein product [Adineta steineri]CAF1589473.1 unnamed protein product [Adineta steineri]
MKLLYSIALYEISEFEFDHFSPGLISVDKDNQKVDNHQTTLKTRLDILHEQHPTLTSDPVDPDGVVACVPDPVGALDPESVVACVPDPVGALDPDGVVACVPNPVPALDPDGVVACVPDPVGALDPDGVVACVPDPVPALDPDGVVACVPDAVPALDPDGVVACVPDPALDPDGVVACVPDPDNAVDDVRLGSLWTSVKEGGILVMSLLKKSVAGSDCFLFVFEDWVDNSCNGFVGCFVMGYGDIVLH